MSKHRILYDEIKASKYAHRVIFREPFEVTMAEAKAPDKEVGDASVANAEEDVALRNLDRVRPLQMLEALKRAHTMEFLQRICGPYFADPERAVPEFEVPCDENVFAVEIRDIVGTLQACEDALSSRTRFGFNIGGGSHHACPGWGAGYCLLNDIAVSLIELKFVTKQIDRAILIDLDVHQGDGNSLFFPPYYELANRADHYEWDWHYNRWKRKERYSHYDVSVGVYTNHGKIPQHDVPADDHPIRREFQHEWVTSVSLHEQNNFPWTKYPSSLDVGLKSEMRDQEYLLNLHNALQWIDANEKERAGGAFTGRQKDAERILVVYVAGADPYEGDSLGGLNVSKEGLTTRDHMVFDWCRRRNLPVATVLAGGYGNVKDVAGIHFSTFCAAMDAFSAQE